MLDKQKCAHGAVIVPLRFPMHPFFARYGLTVQAERRCDCCGRFWFGGCTICDGEA